MIGYSEAGPNRKKRQIPSDHSDDELLYLLSSIGPRKSWLVGPPTNRLPHKARGPVPAANIGEMELGGLMALCGRLGCNYRNIHEHTREELEAEVLRVFPDNESLTPVNLSNVERSDGFIQWSRKTANRHFKVFGPSRHSNGRASNRQHPYAARPHDRPAVNNTVYSKPFPTPVCISLGCTAKEPHLHHFLEEQEKVHCSPEIGSPLMKSSKLTYANSVINPSGRGIEDLRSALPGVAGETPNHKPGNNRQISEASFRPTDHSIATSREDVPQQETPGSVETHLAREVEALS